MHAHAPQRCSILIVAMTCSLTFLGGCEGITEDFAAMTQELIPPSPREAAVDMIDPYDAEKRRRGTTLIANAPFGGAEPYVRLYADKVEHEENSLALAAAIRALARHGGPEHAISIASRLTHESKQVRWEAAKGLQRVHNPQVVPVLLAVARNESEEVDVRQAAIVALGMYPEDRVFQLLVSRSALDARDLALNIAARKSLHTLTGEDFGSDPAAWLRWYNKTEAPFAGKQDFFYPTYSRRDSFFEILAFWTSNHWETPQQPAGLRPSGARSTYEDEGQADAISDTSAGHVGGS